MVSNVPIRRVIWRPCYRIVASRFPPVQLFGRIAEPEDIEAVAEIESLTNDRIRGQRGEIEPMPPEDLPPGEYSAALMAPFAHVNPDGSRFGDGTYGVFYAGRTIETAVAETRYHSEKFMRATHEEPCDLDRRVYVIDLDGDLHDIRGMRALLPNVYSTDDYSESRKFGRTLREQGSPGICYDSLRHHGGECVGAFRPRVLSNCRQAQHLCYVWNGEAISLVYEKKSWEG